MQSFLQYQCTCLKHYFCQFFNEKAKYIITALIINYISTILYIFNNNNNNNTNFYESLSLRA